MRLVVGRRLVRVSPGRGLLLAVVRPSVDTEPELADVTLSPDPAYEGDTFTCTEGTTTDADGTTSFSYTYAWTVSGTDPGVTDNELSSDYYGSGDDIIIGKTAPLPEGASGKQQPVGAAD